MTTLSVTADNMGPDFLGIGMQKTGTGWLYEQIGHHPQIWLPPVKELHYLDNAIPRMRLKKNFVQPQIENLEAFNRERARKNLWPSAPRDVRFCQKLLNAPRRTVDLDYYIDLFSEKGDQITGDITPSYSTLNSEEILSVAKRLPDIKIILSIRDPIERFWSQVCQTVDVVRKKGETFDYTSVELVESFLLSDRANTRSYPTQTYMNWRKHIDQDKVLLCFFDDLKVNSRDERDKILNFLGVDASLLPETVDATSDSKAKNPRVPMNEDIRRMLIGRFAAELDECAELFGGPALNWGAKYGL